MKQFEKAQIEILDLNCNDIITTSIPLPDDWWEEEE